MEVLASPFDSPLGVSMFIGEQALGALLLLLVLVTVVFASNISRSAISVNVYLSFLIYSLSYLLLAITGHLHSERPPLGVCLFQSMLHYASFPLCGATLLALSGQMWLRVFWPSTEHAVLNRLLLFGPYAIWTTVLTEVLAIGLLYQDQIIRNGSPYCWIMQPIPGLTSRILFGLLLIPSMVFQGLTFGPLFASRSSPLTSSAEYRRSLRHRLLRMCIFSAGSLGGLGLIVAFSIETDENSAAILIQGACPLWAVVVFGTQREMFAVWLCWPQQQKVQTQSTIEIVLEGAKA